MKKSQRQLKIITGIGIGTVALLLSVVGCSGTAEPTASDETPAASQELLPITIGYPAANAGYADLYVAMDNGIFEKHGLDAKIVKLNSSAQLVPSLVSKSIDVGVGAIPDTAGAILKGVGLKYIGMTQESFNIEVWGGPDIKSAQDLKGKTYAISSPNSVGDFALTAYLEANGMQRSDVTVKFVGSVAGVMSALTTGAVDAVGVTPPSGQKLPASEFHLVSDMTDIPFPLSGYVATDGYYGANKEVIKRFAAAEVDALKFLRSNKEETIAAINKYSLASDPAAAEYGYNFFLKVWATTPEVLPDLIKKAFQIAVDNGVTGTVPEDVDKYIDNSYYK